MCYRMELQSHWCTKLHWLHNCRITRKIDRWIAKHQSSQYLEFSDLGFLCFFRGQLWIKTILIFQKCVSAFVCGSQLTSSWCVDAHDCLYLNHNTASTPYKEREVVCIPQPKPAKDDDAYKYACICQRSKVCI